MERHPDELVLVLAAADHFKQLNDDFGHAAGDAALASVGARLTEWAGPHGVAGRLGGDEFAALARIEPGHQALRLDHLAPMTTPEQPTLLNWGDRSHFRTTPAPCVLCRKPAMLRSHAGEVVHKVCAEIWNLRNPHEVRFVSDDRPRRRKEVGVHA